MAGSKARGVGGVDNRLSEVQADVASRAGKNVGSRPVDAINTSAVQGRGGASTYGAAQKIVR